MEHRLAITRMATARARASLAIARIPFILKRSDSRCSAIGDRHLQIVSHPGGKGR